jgi:hypothetical protein
VQYDIDIIDYIAIFIAGSVSRFLELFEVYSKLPSLGDIRDKFRLFMRNGVYIKNKQSIGLGGTSYSMNEEPSKGRKGKELSRPVRDTSRSGKGSLQKGGQGSSSSGSSSTSNQISTINKNRNTSLGPQGIRNPTTTPTPLRLNTFGGITKPYTRLNDLVSASSITPTSPITTMLNDYNNRFKRIGGNGQDEPLLNREVLSELFTMKTNLDSTLENKAIEAERIRKYAFIDNSHSDLASYST